MMLLNTGRRKEKDDAGARTSNANPPQCTPTHAHQVARDRPAVQARLRLPRSARQSRAHAFRNKKIERALAQSAFWRTTKSARSDSKPHEMNAVREYLKHRTAFAAENKTPPSRKSRSAQSGRSSRQYIAAPRTHAQNHQPVV
jgi:hypothetical protein